METIFACIWWTVVAVGTGYYFGMRSDMIKYNLMAEAGILLLRYEPRRIDFEQIRRVLGMRNTPEAN